MRSESVFPPVMFREGRGFVLGGEDEAGQSERGSWRTPAALSSIKCSSRKTHIPLPPHGTNLSRLFDTNSFKIHDVLFISPR